MSQSDSKYGSERTNREDCQLFSEFMEGSEESFQALYTRYERQLFLYCKYLLSRQQDAEEVFQETWLRVVRMRRRSTEIEHFRAFLFTVARNTGLKYIERRKRRDQALSLDEVDPGSEWLLKSESGYSELRELVNRALTRVPVLQREAFVLHTMLGYSFDEIAEMQGVSMTAAKTRAFRARKHLRKLLSSWLGMAEEDDPMSDTTAGESVAQTTGGDSEH